MIQKRSASFLPGLLLVMFTLAPLLWVAICAFKADLLAGIPSEVFGKWSLANFEALSQGRLVQAIGNSFAVAAGSSALGTSMATMLAFGLLCRSKPLYRSLLFVISGRLLPAALFLLPQYLLARSLGLTESRVALVLAHSFANTSVALILLSPFVLRIHRAVGDQSRLDNATGWFYFRRVVLPLLARPLLFCFLVTFLLSWTDFLFAGLFTVGENVRTLPVLIGNYLTSYATLWGPMYAVVFVSFALSTLFALLMLGILRPIAKR